MRLPNTVLLAPMSGVSDWPFRQLAARYGAGLVVSEMVASDRLVAREEEARLKLEGAGLPVHAVQLAGCREGDLGEAARLAQGAGAHLIDINMGCPQKRVVGGWAGSALMRDPAHAARLVAAVVAAVEVPVTVKLRLGFDRTMRNAPELARLVEAEGAQLVTVHGRTRCQRYKGRADWGAIYAVRQAVRIPVIANGDCADERDARAMLAASGAAGVMVGRAALGAPWLAGRIAARLAAERVPLDPPPDEVGRIALEHVERLAAHLGEARGLLLARKHVAAYAERIGLAPALRRDALTAPSLALARAAILRLFKNAEPLEAAA